MGLGDECRRHKPHDVPQPCHRGTQGSDIVTDWKTELPSGAHRERDRYNDDPYLFVDSHVTIRKDGTPVLVFGVEQMETELRALLNAVRRGER